MAKNKLFQVYDRKAEMVVGPIMTYNRAGPAVRDYHGLLNNKETQPGRYPEDYDLLEIGEQDDATGAITSQIKVVATGEAYKEQQLATAAREGQ